jgi:hypothetical protein
MPLERYPQPGYELLDDRIPVWRFMRMKTFIRFIESGSLYLCRSDRFTDKHEGLPLRGFVKHVVASMGKGYGFKHTWDNLKADREASFISCWTLDESLYMWKKFAPYGVVVKSQCGVLKSALNTMPARTMVGYVRYSLQHQGFNILNFITTKRPDFALEREVRAFVWQMDNSPRNPYPYVRANGLSYRVDVSALVQEVIVSPNASVRTKPKVQALLGKHGYGSIPVTKSGYTGYGHLLPVTADEIARYARP